MKRLVAFWVVAAVVGVVAAITHIERAERDRESVAAAERTPSAGPTIGGELALGGGAGEDAGESTEPPGQRQLGQTRPEKPADRRTKRRVAATEAARTPRTTAATAASTAAPEEPSSTWKDAPAADASQCPSTASGIVVDRQWQRAWMCADGAIATVFPITSADNQPDPGTYPIYALDYQSSSTFGDAPSTLDRFVAFTYGKFQGARIGFHAVPYYADGSLAQPLDSVGELALSGDSSGCIRLLPDDAELIYGTLQVGDEVRVIS